MKFEELHGYIQLILIGKPIAFIFDEPDGYQIILKPTPITKDFLLELYQCPMFKSLEATTIIDHEGCDCSKLSVITLFFNKQ
jgi:hypothetical protein